MSEHPDFQYPEDMLLGASAGMTWDGECLAEQPDLARAAAREAHCRLAMLTQARADAAAGRPWHITDASPRWLQEAAAKDPSLRAPTTTPFREAA